MRIVNVTTTITVPQVRQIALLANLQLNDEELEKLRHQLSAILEFVGKLKAVETGNVDVTSQVTGLENVTREDIVTPSLPQDVALEGTTQKHNGYFKVKAIFEEE
ncbi:Asp-tRNA(Asn)/Glu-tRNA(Gln) amidotransferase subunit GatC [Candidatus Microgenomates bacterium]|nr:MAG: Asp-tRNA(Asn)/Glu-tRNA(Gln) amidotransferase subunit GatC [Candidatus Microgenomates bacterium]